MNTRYPVNVISKGRADCCLTAKFFIEDGVEFEVMVEPSEFDDYARHLPERYLHELPEDFSKRGQGSIPVRNYVWERAKAAGHDRHWIFDDNIRRVRRWQRGKRIPCNANPAMCAIEDFTDRYENIGISGMNYSFFLRSTLPPFFLNVHVYSCLLIDNALPYRWRGRYNEDTDLCLQVLSGGLCTVLFNAFAIEKAKTMTMKGGNSDELYQGDGRLVMAKSLERVWPGVVDTKRRFGRPQHVIKKQWRGFDTPLKRRADVDWENLKPNEYGMKLKAVAEVRSPELKEMLNEQVGSNT